MPGCTEEHYCLSFLGNVTFLSSEIRSCVSWPRAWHVASSQALNLSHSVGPGSPSYTPRVSWPLPVSPQS